VTLFGVTVTRFFLDAFLVSPHSEEKNMEVAIFKTLRYLEVPKHNRIVENVYF
jgi:hypothetical protein